MRKLTIPNLKNIDVFMVCVEGVAENSLKSKFSCIEQLITNSGDKYVESARESVLFLINSEFNADTVVTQEEMASLYLKQMVGKKGAARSIYDGIRNSAPFNKCPLCGHGFVSTLDHYLPKSSYPEFAVNPQNLIPACSDCNKNKNTYYPKTIDDQILHPYFDNFNEDRWLFGRVCETNPASVIFFVKCPDGLRETVARRLEKHFDLLKLSPLFTSNAANEMSEICHSLIKTHDSSGTCGVKKILTERAESSSSHQKNSWQSAMYHALASSDWFCNGGFKPA